MSKMRPSSVLPSLLAAITLLLQQTCGQELEKVIVGDEQIELDEVKDESERSSVIVSSVIVVIPIVAIILLLVFSDNTPPVDMTGRRIPQQPISFRDVFTKHGWSRIKEHFERGMPDAEDSQPTEKSTLIV